MAASTTADLIGNRYGHLPWRQRVITISTNSTATYFVSEQESGAVFYVPNFAAATLVNFSLPRISSNRLGTNYEFVFTKPTSALDVAIASTIDSSAQIFGVPGTTASTISTASAIAPGTTVGPWNYVTLTAVSSVTWLAQTNAEVESSGVDVVGALVYNTWQTGTTVA